MGVDVGRGSVVGPNAPHEVRPTAQKGVGLGTNRGAPVVQLRMPQHDQTIKLACTNRLIFRELLYLMNGTLVRVRSINLISCNQYTTEKTWGGCRYHWLVVD